MDMVYDRASMGLPPAPGGLYDLVGVPDQMDGVVRVRRSGVSLGLIRHVSYLPRGLELHGQTLVSTLPLDEHHVRVVARHRVARTPIPSLTARILEHYAKMFAKAIVEDIEIWKHKIYRLRPVLSKSDWTIAKFRKWTRQFYDEGVYEAALREEDELRRAGRLP